jgi:hypothetical protein
LGRSGKATVRWIHNQVPAPTHTKLPGEGVVDQGRERCNET